MKLKREKGLIRLARRKADLVLTNLGQILTISGSHSKPVTRPTEESLRILNSDKLAIASSSGRISFVGNRSDLRTELDISSATEVDCKGTLVMPGFVDSHTHTIFAGSREEELRMKLSGPSYLEILKKGGGILKTVRDTRHATRQEILNQTRQRLERMISCGTTTFEIKSGYGLDLKNEIRLLEIISSLKNNSEYDIEPTLLSAHAVPSEYGQVQSYIEEVVKPSIEIAAKRKLATFCDVFLEDGIFGTKEAKDILEYGMKNGLLAKIHADEFSDQAGAHLAAEIGAVSADHLLKSSFDGLRTLAEREVISVLLPGTSLSSFAGSYANAREIIDIGGAVALGTDLSPNSWIESMQFVISLACYGMKMTPAEAIIASTINAAYAIKRGQDIGSIEVGKSCDLLLLNLQNYEEIPYRIASISVAKVVKRGKIVRDNQS